MDVDLHCHFCGAFVMSWEEEAKVACDDCRVSVPKKLEDEIAWIGLQIAFLEPPAPAAQE